MFTRSTVILFVLFVLAAPCPARQITLNPSNVIGGSGSYGGAWDVWQFNARTILDQQSGDVIDVFGNTYWINPDNGPAGAYIVIDLGALYRLTGFDLFNTHNSGYGDRGTGNFHIVAGNFVTNLGGSGFDLTGPTTTIVNGTLTAAPVADPIAAQSFTVSDLGLYRYLRFEPQTVASANPPCCGQNVYGLNELRAFGDPVPEPDTTAMLLLGLAAVFAVRRSAQRH